MEKKKIINVIIVIIVITLMIWIVTQEYKENIIGTQKNSKSRILNATKQYQELTKNETNNIQNIIEKQYPKEEVIETYKGYKVCAKLEIPTISLETFILEEYSTQALNISVTKFWGTNPNTIGNFCVAGHNFKNKNMFSNLKELKVGDKLYLTDNTVGKVEYQIYNMDKVIPEDVSCLDQETNSKEITLITCTNDSQKRIIVKAKEI